MMLEYAPKGLIGALTPQANTTVEPEFNILWPRGYAMLNARLTSPKGTMAERLVDYVNTVEDQVAQFANAPIDAYAFACTGASYLIGHEAEIALIGRVEDRYGRPFVTASSAVTDALNLLGAKHIGLVSPYPPDLNEASTTYWQSRGFDVASLSGAFNDDSSFHPIYSLQGDAAAQALEDMEKQKVEAIVMLGTGMPTLGPIAAYVDAGGPPVLSCMLSLAWRTIAEIDDGELSRERLLAWTKAEHWGAKL